MREFKKFSAFTLVELIIVITILTILWTIAFISYHWFIKTTRDSKRLFNIETIEKGLELFSVKMWVLPEPTNWTWVTYSWAIVWNQWTFGIDTFTNVWNISEIPLDPLIFAEYAYSLNNTKSEYLLAGMIEKWLFSHTNIFSQTYADELKKATALVKWTYNWKYLKISTWSQDYVLAIPSIITSDLTDTDVISILNNNSLVYDGFSNLPQNYKGLWYFMTWGFDFSSSWVIIFSWDINNLVKENYQLSFAKNLKEVYWNSLLKNHFDYEAFSTLDIDVDPTKAKKLVQLFILNEIGGIFIKDFATIINKITINWYNYFKTTDESISWNTVYSIEQDNNWSLWFWTINWVSKFNGQDWLNYNTLNGLTSNTINFVYKDISWNIWLATSAWVSKFDGITWIKYINSNTSWWLAGNTVRWITQDNAWNMWFATSAWVSKFDGTNWTIYTTTQGLANNSTYGIIQDTSWNMWIATRGWWVNKFDGTNWITYTTTQGITGNNIYHIIQDTSWNIWLATSAWVSKFDGITWIKYTNSNTSWWLASNTVRWITQDNTWNVWFATSAWVSKFDGTNWTKYTTNDGLINNYILSLFKDTSWNIWFWTNWWWLTRYDWNIWNSYIKSNFLASNNIKSIWWKLETSWIWIATDFWLNKLDSLGNWSIYDTTTSWLNSNDIRYVILSNSWIIWVAHSAWISKYNWTTWTRYTTTQWLVWSSSQVIFEDNTGNIWIGTTSWVSKFDGTSFVNYTNSNTSWWLANNTVRWIMQDSAWNMWFATSSWVSKFDGENWIKYTTTHWLANNSTYWIIQDSTWNVWIATGWWVSKFDGENWIKYTTTHWLANNSTKSIAKDSYGDIWVGTISWLNKFNSNNNTFTTIDNSVWIINNNINKIYFDSGIMWLATAWWMSKWVIQ